MMYASVSNAIKVDTWDPDGKSTDKIYYTSNGTTYYYFNTINNYNEVPHTAIKEINADELADESKRNTDELYYKNNNDTIITYYYYAYNADYNPSDADRQEFKWQTSISPEVMITNTNEYIKGIKDKSLLYYFSIPYMYYYYDNNRWKSTYYPEEAGVKVITSSIVTAINNDGDSSISLNANKINFVSQAFNIYPSDGDGKTTSSTPNFSVDNKGNVKVKGRIEADSGRLNYGIRIGSSDSYY